MLISQGVPPLGGIKQGRGGENKNTRKQSISTKIDDLG